MVATQQPSAYCQETTGGLQGTVKDPSGAVVPKAHVTITGTTLIGSKELTTDSSGYYHFANLPPGTYTVVVKAEGFETSKRDGLVIETGHVPTVDLILKVGASATTVEVTEAAPVIDTTTTQTQTNISSQTLAERAHRHLLPVGDPVCSHGPQRASCGLFGERPGRRRRRRFPAGQRRQRPELRLLHRRCGRLRERATWSRARTLRTFPAATSSANVPTDFIQDMQITTSAVPAEYGGALGGVVNVILKKGGNEFHGEIFSSYESSGTDANPVNAFLRYDPTTGWLQCNAERRPHRSDPARSIRRRRSTSAMSIPA